jgi:hypothetical protein
MGRVLSIIIAFVAGVVVATLASWLQVPEPPPAAAPPRPPAVAGRGVGTATGRDGAGDVAQRVRELETRLARETAAREQAEEALAQLGDSLAAPRDEHAAPPPPGQPAAQVAPAAATPAPAAAVQEVPAPEPTEVDYSKSELERALIAGGLDAYKAADLKRRSDTLALAEVYLRDQATREGWIDTPRFQEELASLHEQEVSFRNELGDEGYDKYLFALGQTNRVRVDDVMTDSPASQAGLENGDQILRYGDTRIFAPGDLVAQTQQGEPGEMVQLLIIRQGHPMTVEVPRGPLGLRINPTQSMPRRNSGEEF